MRTPWPRSALARTVYAPVPCRCTAKAMNPSRWLRSSSSCCTTSTTMSTDMPVRASSRGPERPARTVAPAGGPAGALQGAEDVVAGAAVEAEILDQGAGGDRIGPVARDPLEHAYGVRDRWDVAGHDPPSRSADTLADRSSSVSRSWFLVTGAPRTVLGALVARVRSTLRRRASCAWSGVAGAGFLTPWDIRSGLGAPMPHTIALVVRGRCRPSPDPISQSASSDRDARGIVTGDPAVGGGQGFLPVLGAPSGGVGRVCGHDRQAVLGGHGHQPGFEFGGGEPGDQLPELLAATVLFSSPLPLEVQVFDGDRRDAAVLGPVQQAGEGVADLCVPVLGAAGQVVGEAAGFRTRSRRES